MYTTIIHPVRCALNLSMNEYCVMDKIDHLSNNRQYDGWCVMSQEGIGNELGLSDRTIRTIMDTLESKGLIEKRRSNRSDTAVRSTDYWHKVITAGKDDVAFAIKRKDMELGSIPPKFFPDRSEETSDGRKSLPKGRKKLPRRSEETSYNNKSNNKKQLNISTNVDSDKSQEYGNPKLNKLLEALKRKIEVDDFKESAKQQRIWLNNLYRLMEKLTTPEFSRRLDIILADSFKHKNCNSLAFIYREVKAFVEVESPGAFIS